MELVLLALANHLLESESVHGPLLGALMLTSKGVSSWITGHPRFEAVATEAVAGHQRTFKTQVKRSLSTLGWYKHTPEHGESIDRELRLKYVHVSTGRPMVIDVIGRRPSPYGPYGIVTVMKFGLDPTVLHVNDQCMVPFILKGCVIANDDDDSYPEIMRWSNEDHFAALALPLLSTGRNGWVPVEVQLHEKWMDMRVDGSTECWFERDVIITTLWKTASPLGAWLTPHESAMERLNNCLNMLWFCKQSKIENDVWEMELSVTTAADQKTYKISVEFSEFDSDDDEFVGPHLQMVDFNYDPLGRYILGRPVNFLNGSSVYPFSHIDWDLDWFFERCTLNEIVMGDGDIPGRQRRPILYRRS